MIMSIKSNVVGEKSNEFLKVHDKAIDAYIFTV